MKKALVLLLVLGFGTVAFAADGFSGNWDTDVSFWPASPTYSDFVKAFASEVDFDYSISSFVFGIESTFDIVGLKGVDFNVDGTLGAFTVSAAIDFAPRILATTATVYTNDNAGTVGVDFDLLVCGTTLTGVVWDSMTVTKTYTAGFDDLKLVGSVSIAGVSVEGLFYLVGADNVGSYTKTGLRGTVSAAIVAAAADGDALGLTQTGSATVASTTNQGSGSRLKLSGTFGGATATARVYFNLEDYWGSLQGMLAYYGSAWSFANYFAESGDWAITCDDCTVRFTGAQLLVEDVSFTCLEVSAMVTFDCCGFVDVKILVEDVPLGVWNTSFDVLVTYTDTDKAISIDPAITLDNACIVIDAAILESETEASQLEFTGIDIRAISLSYDWNGVTFAAETSWDLTHHPILGPGYLGGAISGPTKIYALQPDTDFTVVTFTHDAAADTCTASGIAPAVHMTSGLGYWEVTSFACEKAYAWEKYSIDVDGDSCCGGDYTISADFYFGDVVVLDDLDGTYYYDANLDGDYEAGLDAAEFFVFYGTIDTADVPAVSGFAGENCNGCPTDDCGFEIDEVEWDADYVAQTNTDRLFDWIETDVDVVIAITTAFDLNFGFDITLWGWEDFTFGFDYTF